MSIVLSVDLDYWNRHENEDLIRDYLSGFHDKWRSYSHYFLPTKKQMSSIARFFDHVQKLECPKTLFVEHHHVLRVIQNKPADLLINLDAHDDLGDCALGEGSWVTHVKWRSNARYRWVYRDYWYSVKHGMGFCNGDIVSSVAGEWTSGHGYKSIEKTHSLNLPWGQNILAVVFCISPLYTERRTGLFALKQVLGLPNLEFGKGAKELATELMSMGTQEGYFDRVYNRLRPKWNGPRNPNTLADAAANTPEARPTEILAAS